MHELYPTPETSRQDDGWLYRVALTIGFLALTVAVFVAHANPATRYEVSMYASTPPLFWAALAVAAVVALYGTVVAPADRPNTLAFLLGGTTFAIFASLPLVRGYAFYGTGDALTHLGYVRDILANRISLFELLYPGLHGTSLVLADSVGISLERSMMLVVFLYALAFLAFVSLTVRELVGNRRAVGVALFSSFMLLPLNDISAWLAPHPSTLAVLFLPFQLVLLVRYLHTPSPSSRLRPSTTGALLALSSVGITLIHPQQAANVLLVFGLIAAFQFLYRRFGSGDSLRPIYGQTVFLGLVFVGWSLTHERVSGAVSSLVSTLVFGAPTAGAIAQRGGSLSAIGVSLVEVYLKLFFVSTIYILLAGLLVLVALRHHADDSWAESREISYLGLGLVPVGVLFVLYLLAQIQVVSFRHLAFIMALLTIVGAVALYRLGVWLDGRGPSLSGRTVAGSLLALGLGVMLVLSAVTVYPSPYIYQPSQHVTEMQLDGYDAAFASQAEDVTFLGIRQGPSRYREAIEGHVDIEPGEVRRANGVDSAALASDLPAAYDGMRYLVVTPMDREREVTAYRELTYTASSLQNVDRQPGVDRVYANGGFELYVITDR